jgi:putative CocE/NonD family hydrolase
MGPWIHGGWNSGTGGNLGPMSFGAATAEYYREKIELPFFEHHLKGNAEAKLPEALAFETGTNVWREYAEWPPRSTEPFELRFHRGGRLTSELDPPEATPRMPSHDPGYDEYRSDPAKPVPYTDQIAFRLVPEFMAGDQRFASSRPDVLVYETLPLKESVTLVGPLEVKLEVATSGTDSDWVVKLIDAYPPDMKDPEPNPTGARLGNYQQLVRGEVMRAKFRESLETPKPVEPNHPTIVKLTLPDINHTFRAGHRIMVQVQSSWFPLVDRNPQTFVDIYQATERDYRPAVQRLYRAPTRITARRLK